MSAEAVFRAKAPVLMKRLMAEGFGFGVDDAAAIAGNGGHESRGFTAFQEERPTVKGSRGGWSWFQWTGPRRRAFEAYCAKTGLGLKSDEAATAFLILELKGPERAAVAKTKAALTLADKVVAFEMGYERAGVKHYPQRLHWAQIARDAYYKSLETQPAPPKPVSVETPPAAPPPAPRPPYKPSIQLVMAVLAGLATLVAAFLGLK